MAEQHLMNFSAGISVPPSCGNLRCLVSPPFPLTAPQPFLVVPRPQDLLACNVTPLPFLITA